MGFGNTSLSAGLQAAATTVLPLAAPELESAVAPADRSTVSTSEPTAAISRAPTPPKRGRGRPKGAVGPATRALRAIEAQVRQDVAERVADTLTALEQALGARVSPMRLIVLASIGRWLTDLAVLDAYVAEHGIMSSTKDDISPIAQRRWELTTRIHRALEMIGLDADYLPERGGDAAWAELAGRHQPTRARDATANHGGDAGDPDDDADDAEPA